MEEASPLSLFQVTAMSAARPSPYRFAPRLFRSRHGALFSCRFVALITLVGTPLLGGMAIATNYFRLPGLENKINGLMAATTGIVGSCLMFSLANASQIPVLTLVLFVPGSAWLAHATAHDCFASYYSGAAQYQWTQTRSDDENR